MLDRLQVTISTIATFVMCFALFMLIDKAINLETMKIILASCGAVFVAQIMIEVARDYELINI